jgi:hypothetical protein
VEIQMSRALLPVTVTDVDELHWVGRLAGGEDPAAGCDPPWPVGETVGSVVRTYDQARPDDQAPLAERRRWSAAAHDLAGTTAHRAGSSRLGHNRPSCRLEKTLLASSSIWNSRANKYR